jgi:RNA polymerase sigma factor (sigma-70 family)
MRGVRSEAGRQLERLFRVGAAGGLTDAQLLEQFVAGDADVAEAAFEAIVGRHGPMVLRVCRTVLHDVHAADDAFQATFLVLARKARTLGRRQLLCNWLYGVATRTARQARSSALRRRVCEREAAARRSVLIDDRLPDERASRYELGRILHEEIGRLPGSYRTAVVVCYLEGMTSEQAARQLHLGESTMRGRLARARKLLGCRLARRGVSLSVTLLALGNAPDTAAASVRLPEAAVQSLARAARLFGKSGQATGGAVSATAQSIARGVLSTMWLHSLKTVASALAAITLCVAGPIALVQRSAKAQPQVEASDPTAAAAAAAATRTPPAPASQDTLSAALVEAASFRVRDSGTGRPKSARDGEPNETQSIAVSLDLVKIVPAPIVRAIPVTKDCMILSYIADWAHGNVDNIGVANNQGGVRTLIDWSDIPPEVAAAPERRFLLALYARDTNTSPRAGPIHAFAISEDWPELTSWKTQPAYELDPAATYRFEPGPGWKLFDVTPVVREQAKPGRKGHGVLLRFLSEDFAERRADWSGYSFVSREGTGEWAQRHPVLLVVEGSKSEPTRRAATEQPRAESLASENRNRPLVTEGATPKHPQSGSLDPLLVGRASGPIVRWAPVSKDCMVLSYIPGWNFGSVDNIGIGNNGGGVRTLIDWPQIPPDEASSPDRQFLIALYSRQTISHPPAGPIHAFEILEEWSETTSWMTQPRYRSEPVATYDFEPGEGWKLFDITPLVRAQAKAGRQRHGLVLRFLGENLSAGPKETFSDYKLVSREGAGEWAKRRPVLLVVKTARAGKIPTQ